MSCSFEKYEKKWWLPCSLVQGGTIRHLDAVQDIHAFTVVVDMARVAATAQERIVRQTHGEERFGCYLGVRSSLIASKLVVPKTPIEKSVRKNCQSGKMFWWTTDGTSPWGLTEYADVLRDRDSL